MNIKLITLPILATSLLFSCGGSTPSPDPDTYDFDVTCDHCTVTGNQREYKPGADISLTFTPDVSYRLPEKKNVTVSGITAFEYTIDESGVASFVCTMPARAASVTLSAFTGQWYNMPDWWNYCSNGIEGQEATTRDIGKEVSVTVYDKVHKVRLIDVNHMGIDGKTPEAHCTFEFENLITDSNGEAVTTVWNNKAGESSTNCKFPDSTLNDLLNKTSEANCIFTKLPSGLQKAIKEVDKPIAISEDDGDTYDVVSYSTKLFPLSYREMTATGASEYAKEEGTTYAFYKGSGDTDDNRIKKAVGGSDGEYYWLRSPYLHEDFINMTAYLCCDDGYLNGGPPVYTDPVAVAPAFCI